MVARFSIRIATPDDADAVGALLAASYPALLAGRYDPETLARALPLMTKANPKLLASGSYYIAAGDVGDVIGCGGWTMERPGTGEVVAGEAHIRHVGVHPAATKRGVGAALIVRCVEDARARGVTVLHCYSTLNAEGFYRASGFETVGPLDVPMGPGLVVPSILMRRAI